jgi:hypothetical protein
VSSQFFAKEFHNIGYAKRIAQAIVFTLSAWISALLFHNQDSINIELGRGASA